MTPLMLCPFCAELHPVQVQLTRTSLRGAVPNYIFPCPVLAEMKPEEILHVSARQAKKNIASMIMSYRRN